MTQTELCYTPATALAAMIRSKQVSPVEVTRAVLARIEQVNPKLNAFCTVTAESALAEARAAEAAVMAGGFLGPLHGVPYSIKDLALTRGVRSMGGSFIFEHRVPDQEAPFVRRLREAGGVFLGKTTSPEFGWKALSDSPLTGITRNPWNPAMTAGGSSSGAAVAAATGLGPIAHGSDGAGSIRIPAGFCGVFGHKPSYGRVPQWPVSNNDYQTHNGPLTRTVEDAALMLSVIAGPDDCDRTCLSDAPADYVGKLGAGIKGLRVLYSPTMGGLRVDPDVAAVVRAAAKAFEGLGATVEEQEPSWPDTQDVIRITWAGHEAGIYGPYLPKWRDKMDPGLVACIEDGFKVSVVDYIQARGKKNDFWDAVHATFQTYDLMLTPTISVGAFPVPRLNPEGWRQHAWDWFPWAGFSYPFNFTGQPAATVPAGFTPAGLPVGLQIVGRRLADLTVLQAAAAFEAARPWAGKRPPVD